MTGWRCGWSIGPATVIAAQTALQSHATSNVSSITQKAVIAALTGSQEPVTMMLDEYRKRRDNLHAWLTADPRIQCTKPAGAFYLFPDLREVMAAAGFANTNELAQALLDESRVAVTPGRGVRCARFRADLVRDLDGEPARGQSPTARVRGQAAPLAAAHRPLA